MLTNKEGDTIVLIQGSLSTNDAEGVVRQSSGHDFKEQITDAAEYTPGPALPRGNLPASVEPVGNIQRKDEPGYKLMRVICALNMGVLYALMGPNIQPPRTNWRFLTLTVSIALLAYVISLSISTTGVYYQFATSYFGFHSLLGTIAVVSTLAAAIATPIYGKICNASSRGVAFALAVTFFCLGGVLIAAAPSVEALAAGQVFSIVGNIGLELVTTVLIADMATLQWRGVFMGLNNLPTLLNTFVSGFISQDISAFQSQGWRWGYGMFVILLPVAAAPGLYVLLGSERIARKEYNRDSANISDHAESNKRGRISSLYRQAMTLDMPGGIVLAAGVGCFLTPFTLAARAKGGYSNPSMIALLVVGSLLTVTFAVWERFVAAPIIPRRILNRTYVVLLGINVVYQLSNAMEGTFYNSWVFVIKDYSTRDYQFFTNSLPATVSVFYLLAGAFLRMTRRFKNIMIAALVFRVLGMALIYASARGDSNTGILVASQIILGTGTGMTIVSTLIGIQAAVSHQDLPIAVAFTTLCSFVANAIGAAIATSLWNRRLLSNLAKDLVGLSPEQVLEIFSSIQVAKMIPAPARLLVIQAYSKTVEGIFLPSLCVACIGLVMSLFVRNISLDQTPRDEAVV